MSEYKNIDNYQKDKKTVKQTSRLFIEVSIIYTMMRHLSRCKIIVTDKDFSERHLQGMFHFLNLYKKRVGDDHASKVTYAISKSKYAWILDSDLMLQIYIDDDDKNENYELNEADFATFQFILQEMSKKENGS